MTGLKTMTVFRESSDTDSGVFMNTTETVEKLVLDGKLPEYRVLFVCTGNTCRSPMAEVLYNSLAKKIGINSTASSAGLFANGANISQHAKTVLLENGLVSDGFSRKSVQIDGEMCKNADVIIGMTDAHAMRLIISFPEYASKIKALDTEIGDPFGGYLDTYRECFEQIKKAVTEEFFAELL